MHLNSFSLEAPIKSPEIFLPTSKKEIEKLGWETLDVILFSGDAYVDHPAFGNAIIGRYLQSLGLKVAIVPQPNWRDDLRDFKKLGQPKYFFAVTAGNMDSMINHYTAQKRLRSDDAYTAGDKAGQRPDYPTIVYTKILKSLYPQTPVIIGGIEASLRRLTHYDYWQDTLKPSILFESQADLLVYGMAEQPLKAIVASFQRGDKKDSLKTINQVAYLLNNDSKVEFKDNYVELPSHQKCLKEKAMFGESFVLTENEINKANPAIIVQKVYDKTVVVNPPFAPITEEALDSIYELPFIRKPHFRYKEKIPAYEMIKDSVTIHRGCFGGCSFCTLAAHQSKFISSRSEKSIIKEIEKIAQKDDFKGHITDMGGPSANMYMMNTINEILCEKCSRPSCVFPALCKNINNSHQPLNTLYKRASRIKGVNKITIGSGVRYDLFITENKEEAEEKGFNEYMRLLLSNHVSGRLKVAPEHTSEDVLKIMRKPSFKKFVTFKNMFDGLNNKMNLNLQLIPYFISGHPGTGYSEMAELAVLARQMKIHTEQVQDFTPTPMTLSSVIYYTGVNPYTKEKIYSAKNLSDKELQKKFFFYHIKENKEIIKNILLKIRRGDLILKLYSNK